MKHEMPCTRQHTRLLLTCQEQGGELSTPAVPGNSELCQVQLAGVWALRCAELAQPAQDAREQRHLAAVLHVLEHGQVVLAHCVAVPGQGIRIRRVEAGLHLRSVESGGAASVAQRAFVQDLSP